MNDPLNGRYCCERGNFGEIHDCEKEGPALRPSMCGDAGTGSIKQRWWVALMAGLAHRLWAVGWKRASWLVADLCFWLQDAVRSRATRAVVALLALSLAATGQTPTDPKTFSAFGASLNGGHIAGFTNTCRMLFARNYGCLDTESTGRSSATHVGAERIAWRYGAIAISVKGGYGFASGSDGSAGGSYNVGGSVIISTDSVLKRHPGWAIVFSGAAEQDNVKRFIQSQRGIADFRDLGRQALFHLGVGKRGD